MRGTVRVETWRFAAGKWGSPFPHVTEARSLYVSLWKGSAERDNEGCFFKEGQ